MTTDAGYTYKLECLATGYGRGEGRKVLLSGMDARLRRGELTCLIGVNGAGKSTLLRTLAGLQPPLGGSVELLGRRLGDYSRAELARLVGVVLTDDIPEQNLTAQELVEMGRVPYTGYWGAMAEADREMVDRAFRLTGTGAFRHRRLSTLSDGERQKLLIAKALAQDTEVILLDEPVAFLDFPNKVGVLRLLSRIAVEEGKSVLVSIHDIELALQMAHRLWVLRADGFAEGRPSELARRGDVDFLFEGQGVVFDREKLQYSLTTTE